MDVAVDKRGADRVRVLADKGAEVSCAGPEGPFARHCVLTDVAPGLHAVFVRATAALAGKSAIYGVRVHTTGGLAAATIHQVTSEEGADTSSGDDPSDSTAPSAPEPVVAQLGTYVGTALLVQHGLTSESSSELIDVARVGLALDAELFEVSKVRRLLAIRDPQRIFNPDESWVITLDAQADGSWTGSAPARVVGDGTQQTLVRPEVLAAGVGSLLELLLDLKVEGLAPQTELVSRWSFSFSHLGEPSGASAPASPATESLPFEGIEARLSALSPWYESTRERLRSFNVEMQDTTEGSLWQCEIDATQHPLSRLCEQLNPADRAPCQADTQALAQGRVLCGGSCGLLTGCSVAGNYCDFGAKGMLLRDASACAQLHLCWEAPESPSADDVAQLGSSYLSRALSGFTVWGDLQCEDGASSASIEYLANTDSASARVQLEQCADDVERYWKGPSAVASQGALGLAALSQGTAGCLDARRFDAALHWALTTARARAEDPTRTPDGRSDTLGMRLLYQWAQVHGFLAREALESDTLVAVIGGPGDANERTLDEYLDLSLAGWGLVLQPRVAGAVLAIPGSILAHTDYREQLAGAALENVPPLHHEQGMGLPVVWAETLTSQLEAARALLSRARFAGTGRAAALRRAGAAALSATRILALADVLVARVGASTPGWSERYRAARETTVGAFAALTREARALEEGENPLGIADTDLPLTFAGDPVDPSARFSAVSDFLVGDRPGASSWGPAAVDRAEVSLQAARTAWVEQRERELDKVLDAGEVDRRLEGLRREYGGQVVSLCGRGDPLTILDQWGTGRDKLPDCFLVEEQSACEGTRKFFAATLDRSAVTDNDVALTVCIANRLRTNGSALVEGLGRRSVRAVGHPTNETVNAALDSREKLTLSGANLTIGSRTFPVEELYAVQFSGASTSSVESAYNVCRRSHGRGRFPLPSTADTGGHRIDPACVRGSLGNAFLDVQSARAELDLARAELTQIGESFEIALESCQIRLDSAEAIEQMQLERDAIVHAFRGAKLAADVVHLTTNMLTTTMVKGEDLLFPVGAAGRLGLATTAIVAGNLALGFQFAIDTTITAYDAKIATEERFTEIRTCLNDARQHLVSASSAALRIEQSTHKVKEAITNLKRLADGMDGLVVSGRAAIALEQSRVARAANARAPLANDRWLGAQLTTFRRDMRLAQRAIFLAVRAVSYELQADVKHLEAAALAARRPDELRAVIDELLSLTANRGVAGRSPSQLVTVLSMRQDLLRLVERPGYTKEDRFRVLLTEHPVLDDAGALLGYQVPFSLLPASGTDGTGAVEIFATNDCAERLWTVSASIHGRDLYAGESPPSFVRIDLLKSNTFASQWCGRSGLQNASFDPSRNLFADPLAGAASGAQADAASGGDGFTRGRMRAFFDVDRNELERDSYTEGASPELAARGLYGDYALFLPVGVLSQAGSNGLVLDAVDDILLRLEYVSVAH